jgi:putative hemolysin
VAALKLSQDPTPFLATVQIGITLIGIVAGYFGGSRLGQSIGDILVDAGLGESLANVIGVAGVIALITYFSLVFGEIVPKRIGLHGPEQIAARVALPMVLLSRVARPFVAILTGSTNTIIRMLRLSGEEEAALTEEEIRLLIGMSAESGSVAEDEAALLERVFHFGDRKLHEVMVPRTEAVWLERDATIDEFYEVYRAAPHSRFPVIDGSADHVVGVLGIKDVLAALADGSVSGASPIEPMLRPPFFVPESKAVGELFREMQKQGSQMAIAVDEFGGTAGITTLEQLLEEMVGKMGDELQRDEPEFEKVDELTTRVDGSLSIDEARDELGIDLPEGPYDTIAGFVLNELGRVPDEGEEVAIDGYRIVVAEMRGPKIEQLSLTRLERQE